MEGWSWRHNPDCFHKYFRLQALHVFNIATIRYSSCELSVSAGKRLTTITITIWTNYCTPPALRSISHITSLRHVLTVLARTSTARRLAVSPGASVARNQKVAANGRDSDLNAANQHMQLEDSHFRLTSGFTILGVGGGGVPYWGPYYKGIAHTWGLYQGPLIFVNPTFGLYHLKKGPSTAPHQPFIADLTFNPSGMF